MRYFVVTLLAFLFVINSSMSFKKRTISIQTSAICGECKVRIENAVKGVKGVLAVRLDLNTKKLKVKYDDAVTNPDDIRKVVSETGYKADQIEPVKNAYQKLPDCCRKPGLCTD